MGAAGIELPEWVTDKVIERTYRRVQELRAKGEDHRATRSLLVRGMNAARAQSPVLLLFLDKGAEVLRRFNDEQQSRFDQEGYRRVDYSEFSAWREAYLLCVEPRDDVKYRVFGFIYAAAAEAVL
jgi:hypothetical protein